MTKAVVVSLDSCGGTGVAVNHCAINHIESRLPLVQPHLEIGLCGAGAKVNRAPLDVEDAIGSSTGHRGVNTAGASRITRTAGLLIGTQITPIRQDGVIVSCPWQADIAKGRIARRELGVAV